MGFTVEPSYLRDFATMLERTTDVAQDINLYPKSFQLFAGGAIYEEIRQFHNRAEERANARMDLVHHRLFWSRYGMEEAVEFYESTDRANAERLDRTYPAAKGAPPPPDPPTESPAVPSFVSYYPDEYLKVPADELDADDLEPKATTLEDGLELIGDIVSPYAWIRDGLSALGCGDPFGDMIRVYAGDWRIWARTAKMWRNCGGAYRVVATSVEQHRDLAYFWQGNAADAAHVYFGKLASGIDAEHAFHEFLYGKYRDIVDVVHQSFEECEFLLGVIIDTFLTLGVGTIVKAGSHADDIIKIVSRIGDINDAAQGTVLAIGSEPLDGSGNEPPCPLEDLVSPGEGRTDGYRHPSEKE